MLIFLTSGSRGWAKYYSDNGSLFLRIQNVGKNRILLDDITYVTAPKNAEAQRTLVQSGDVLLSITADLGRTCVVPQDIGLAFINQHLAVLRVKDIEPVYLSAFLASQGGQLQFASLNRQGVKAGLNFDDIRSLKILCPPQNLQTKYCLVEKKILALRERMQQEESKFNNLFNSLQQRAFSGELFTEKTVSAPLLTEVAQHV